MQSREPRLVIQYFTAFSALDCGESVFSVASVCRDVNDDTRWAIYMIVYVHKHA